MVVVVVDVSRAYLGDEIASRGPDAHALLDRGLNAILHTANNQK